MDGFTKNTWFVLCLVSTGILCSSLTLSALNPAVPEIANELKATATEVGLLPAVFMLTNTIFMMPFGRMSDRFGRKRVFVLRTLFFGIASLMASFAPSFEVLISLRAVQGIASAMIFSTGIGIVSSVSSKDTQGLAIGIVIAVGYVGLSAGPLLGGWLTENHSWRFVFLSFVPLSLFAVTVGIWFVRGDWKSDLVEPFDWSGFVGFSASIFCLFFSISVLPNPNAYALLVIGLILMSIFCRDQLRKKHPLIKIRHLLENSVLGKSLLSAVLMYMAATAQPFLLSLYFQYSLGLSPTFAGLILVVPAVIVAVASPLSGRLSNALPRGQVTFAGSITMSLGLLLLLGVMFDYPLFFAIVGSLFYGLGFGIFLAPNYAQAMASVSSERLGVGSALLNVFRTVGTLLGALATMLAMALLIGDTAMNMATENEMQAVVGSIVLISCVCSLVTAYIAHSLKLTKPKTSPGV
ncbi:MFS transporter [Candidatus Foliamicus sp.]